MFGRIKEDVEVIFERDPAARSTVEVLTTSPGLHAILMHRFNHFLWRKRCYLLARLSAYVARFLTGVEIHPAATIGRRFFIDHGMGIVIGETSKIGDDCSIYHGVTLGGTVWNKGKRHPTLEDGVVVGAGAKILGPVTVGHKARIGSNAVVVEDVPENTTVVGIPSHVIKRDKKKTEREKFAEKAGFDAYAAANMPDPVENAINEILEQLQALQKKNAEMEKKIEKDH